jgi:hypothetical protein
MGKVLIIGNRLSIGGAERLIYELVCFAKVNSLIPVLLILDNYDKEFYDDILKKMNVKIVRTRLTNILHYRAPIKMLRSMIWVLRLKLFVDRFYDSIHVIGLYNMDKGLLNMTHDKRFLWNVNNVIQFNNREYPFSGEIFKNPKDTIICINSYQVDELKEQYGDINIKSKIILFKLFAGKHDAD